MGKRSDVESSGVAGPNGSARMFRLERRARAAGETETETMWGARPAPSMFSPHGHVLIEIARDKDVQIAQIADRLGLAESDVRQIVDDLIASGVTAQITVDRQPEYIIAPEPSSAQGAIGPRSTRAIDRMYGRRP